MKSDLKTESSVQADDTNVVTFIPSIWLFIGHLAHSILDPEQNISPTTAHTDMKFIVDVPGPQTTMT